MSAGKAPLITFENDPHPITWEQLKKTKLNPEIKSLEEFNEKIETNLAAVANILGEPGGISPNAKTVDEVQRTLFKDIFAHETELRKEDTLLRKSGKTDQAFSPAAEIESHLNDNALKSENLLNEPSRSQKLRQISEFHAGIMAIHPIDDLEASFALNRLLAIALTEGQLNHCFGQRIKHTLDGEKYIDALKKCLNEGDIHPFHKLMKELLTVLDFDPSKRKGPGHDHEL